MPSSNPTSEPSTYLKEDMLKFDVKVLMNGFATSILDDQTQYALIAAVATISQLSTTEVAMSYTARAENLFNYIRRLREKATSRDRKLITTYSMEILYTITTRISSHQDIATSGNSLYQSISTNVQESVSNGIFQQLLVSSCTSNCSVDFSTIVIEDVVIYSPSGSTNKDKGSNSAIFGALAVLVIPVIIFIMWKLKWLQARKHDSAEETSEYNVGQIEDIEISIESIYLTNDKMPHAEGNYSTSKGIEMNTVTYDNVSGHSVLLTGVSTNSIGDQNH